MSDGGRSIDLVVAGLSFHCSQKIHNQVVGLSSVHAYSKYVIILDDDIQLHPGTMRAWVEEMETDAEVFVASGYSFDWVPPEVKSFSSYLVMMWRLVCSAAFPEDRPAWIWGGAMMLRTEDIRNNTYDIMDAWRDGGYSEDLITIHICRQKRRAMAAPKAAIFPNKQGEVPFHKYWNYLCRQVFVLDTYASSFHKYQVHGAAFSNGMCNLFIFLGCVCATMVILAIGGVGASKGTISEECYLPAASVVAMFLGLCWMTLVLLYTMDTFASMCSLLSPSKEKVVTSHMGFFYIMLVYVLHTAMVPTATFWVFTHDTICWAKVWYTKKGGKIMKMERLRPDGSKYSVSRLESLETYFKGEFQRQKKKLDREMR